MSLVEGVHSTRPVLEDELARGRAVVDRSIRRGGVRQRRRLDRSVWLDRRDRGPAHVLELQEIRRLTRDRPHDESGKVGDRRVDVDLTRNGEGSPSVTERSPTVDLRS